MQQPYEVYSDEELRARFRFGSRSIEFLEQLLGEDIRRTTERNQPVPVKMQILVALRFYATGHFFQVIGDLFGLHKSTVSRIVHRVSELLERRKDDFIVFPTVREDINEAMEGFEAIANFPNVVGCVDGTHIRILRPPEEEYTFVCRKGYHSVNVQVVSDHIGELNYLLLP